MARKAGPEKISDDQRLQRWMEWYDRNQQKSEYRRGWYALLTEAEREKRREERRLLYAKRIKDGWTNRERKHRTDVTRYRTLLIALLMERDKGICGICGRTVSPGEESPDHIIPLTMGGQDTAANIRLAHRECNNRRPKKPADIRRKLEAQASNKEALS